MPAVLHGLETVGTTLCGLTLAGSDGRDRRLRYICLIPGLQMAEKITCKKCRQQKGLD